MKKPIHAALDLHSRHSVLGSMDHDGQTQPRMRFGTEANILRAQVERLRQRRRPLYLTMEAGALTRWANGIVRPLVDRLIVCEPRHNRLINSNPTKSDEADVAPKAFGAAPLASSKKYGWDRIAPARFTGRWFTSC